MEVDIIPKTSGIPNINEGRYYSKFQKLEVDITPCFKRSLENGIW